jgi:hypothetical protein
MNGVTALIKNMTHIFTSVMRALEGLAASCVESIPTFWHTLQLPSSGWKKNVA